MSKQKINSQQKNKLLDLMVSRPQLRSGKFSFTFTHKDSQKEWEEIAEILNSIPGARKEWKAWRKTWQDILSKTKAKSANINKIRRGTGGGPPPTDCLDEFEEGVAALLHPHVVSGHTESVESVVIFEDTVSPTPPASIGEVAVADLLPPMELNQPHNIIINEAVILPPPVEYSGMNETGDIEGANVTPPPQTNDKTNKRKKRVNMKTLLQEKVIIKRELLEEKRKLNTALISNMERQTKALEDISAAFNNIANRL